MNITTILKSAQTLARGAQTFIADNSAKVTTLLNVLLNSTEQIYADIVQSLEAAADRKSSGGMVRIMFKSTMQMPRWSRNALGAFVVTPGVFDVLQVHLVAAVPKAVASTLTSSNADDSEIREVYAYLLAKGASDVCSLAFGTAVTPLPATSSATLITNALASTSPLRRAFAGLVPLDTANGAYGHT